MSRQIGHRPSHANLLRDVSTSAVPLSRSRLDAIVVPAARPSSALQNIIDLSVTLSVPLVILCSRQTNVAQVAERVDKTLGACALVVEVPIGYELPGRRHLTSSAAFQEASAGRSSDLSLKRNLGLLLGRLLGWNKLLFVDDDISQLRPVDVRRLTSLLDRHPIASMATREFPDNSVVCHARRLAGFEQDIFVGGAVLGVQLKHPELSFFPDIYNEDWFFFARRAAERSLPKAGEVRQLEYLPYDDRERAAREEFGDLLAEGLYALFESTRAWGFDDQMALAAKPSYWSAFRDVRLAMIHETLDKLARERFDPEVASAEEALRRAEKQASGIGADLCVGYLEAWLEDTHGWQEALKDLRPVGNERNALSDLSLTNWISCGYGERLSESLPLRQLAQRS
ncbi:hypothetical protein E1263_26055 [Kribbella antibiotica]|uniref:Glycosyltransferase family 2 protein n=1 Tax=Kribbella antibiotica TaxID=190195 RepID=A0A4V2YNS9_9ACTN|nr:hypothetical protein [Kribbella antibiotica]TDD55417.1 hypothetical protein E1263_26055 [Kribbella antibiotica]